TTQETLRPAALQIHTDAEAGGPLRATERTTEVDAHALAHLLRVPDRQRRAPILEADARCKPAVIPGAGTGHRHLARSGVHRSLAADAVVGPVEAIVHVLADLIEALVPGGEPLVGVVVGRLKGGGIAGVRVVLRGGQRRSEERR